MTRPDEPSGAPWPARPAGPWAGPGGGAAGGGPAGLPPHLDPRLPPSASLPRIARGSRRIASSPHAPSSTGGGRHRRRRPLLVRLLSYVAATLSIAVFAVAALGYVLYSKYDGNIDRISGLSKALPGLNKPAAAPRGARNVLLVGSDTRDTTGNQFQGKGAEATKGQRSDTIILAHLYGGSDQAELVSFPRDSWVQIPAFTDPATGQVHPSQMNRINSAMNEGGPALLIATVENLTGIRVDNYVQIDFAGFQQMVDALGGVEVCLNKPAREKDSGIDLKAGRQVVKGAQALAFVRQRKELPNGDIDRIRRQQAFIASITREVLSSGTLLDPFKLNAFLNVATSSVKVDDTLSGTQLTQLALRLKGFTAGGVAFTTLPYTTLEGEADGQRYLIFIDRPKAEALFSSLRRDRPPGEPAATPSPGTSGAPLTVAPRAVRVSVLNAAGTAGLGRRVADDLAGEGFVVVGAPGNRGTGAADTVVRYAPSRAEAARTLAAAVPGATLELDASLGATLELVVGTSYAGVVPVTVAGAPSATPSPGAAAPPVTAASTDCVD